MFLHSHSLSPNILPVHSKKRFLHPLIRKFLRNLLRHKCSKTSSTQSHLLTQLSTTLKAQITLYINAVRNGWPKNIHSLHIKTRLHYDKCMQVLQYTKRQKDKYRFELVKGIGRWGVLVEEDKYKLPPWPILNNIYSGWKNLRKLRVSRLVFSPGWGCINPYQKYSWMVLSTGNICNMFSSMSISLVILVVLACN